MKSITGIELAEKFYNEYGKPMLEGLFADKLDKIAVGLVGHGSECFGYDDDISKDHDFEPGFTIWLDDESNEEFGFKLFRAYSKLPKEYMGIKVQNQSLFGSKTKGVHTIRDFYSFYTGTGDVPKDNKEWLNIPSFYLAEATNGKVFYDGLGEFTRIRNILKNEMPIDVWNKKLASALFLMAQSGQYNYMRCLKHGEKGAAVLALNEFAKNLLEAVFVINKKHCPYYKWAIRKMSELQIMGNYAKDLNNALANPLLSETQEFIEKISGEIISRLSNLGYAYKGDYLEPYAFMVNDNIKDNNLRNMNIIL